MSPVLFLIFNRPSVTQRSFQAIRKARPGVLFVAADGPRAHVASDELQCDQARKIVEQVDWECQVETRFLSRNRGCQLAVSEAISWFFEHVDQGIILEDDCVADASFFRFSAQLLDLYLNDERVGVITGDNFQGGQIWGDSSYYFSKYNHCWGWATWRRAWDHFDYSMNQTSTRDIEVINQFACAPGEERYWSNVFRRVRQGKINSWAYRWKYCCWKNEWLTATPQINLVENIGFDSTATHTKRKGLSSPDVAGQVSYPLVHPNQVSQQIQADAYCAEQHFNVNPSLTRRVRDMYSRVLSVVSRS